MSAVLTGRERILVRAPNWLGDFIAAEPSIRALHAHAGRASTLMAPPRFVALFDGRFDGMLRLPTDADQDWRERDVGVLLDGSWRSAWRAFHARIPVRAGFASGGRGALLTHAFSPARERGEVPVGIGRAGRFPRRLPRPFAAACAELLGWLGVTVRDRRPRILVSDRARDEVDTRLVALGLRRGEPFVLANAGSRPGSAKGFPPESFAASLDDLARRTSLPVVIACGPGEEEAARETALRCTSARTIQLLDPPVDLPALAALSAAARIAIGPDNGARHVAEALDVPCVVLMGPTDPRYTAEHPVTTRVLRVEVPCGPCHREICPLAGDARHACMRRIDPARVAEAAAELLR